MLVSALSWFCSALQLSLSFVHNLVIVLAIIVLLFVERCCVVSVQFMTSLLPHDAKQWLYDL